MCQEISDHLKKLQVEGGMPKKVSGKIYNILTKGNIHFNSNIKKTLIESDNCDCEEIMGFSNNSNNNISNNNINSNSNDDSNKKNIKEIYNSDILANSTQWTRIIFEQINKKSIEFSNSNLYKTLTKTTQPAHLIVACILGFVLYTIWPEMLGYGNKQKNIFITIIYLLAVATHFGALIWMTFFSGLALYFSLPRHTFGQCQHVLFPIYFTLNSVLSVLAFTTFIKIKSGHWNRNDITQALVLALCAIIEIIVRLYLAPAIVSLMKVKYNFEKLSGTGKEIGYLDQKDLLKCPHYQGVNKRFRKIHMGAALSNMTALACSLIHIMYLAQKISIS